MLDDFAEDRVQVVLRFALGTKAALPVLLPASAGRVGQVPNRSERLATGCRSCPSWLVPFCLKSRPGGGWWHGPAWSPPGTACRFERRSTQSRTVSRGIRAPELSGEPVGDSLQHPTSPGGDLLEVDECHPAVVVIAEAWAPPRACRVGGGRSARDVLLVAFLCAEGGSPLVDVRLRLDLSRDGREGDDRAGFLEAPLCRYRSHRS